MGTHSQLIVMAPHSEALSINLGDLPTWLGFIAAAIAAYFVYGQLKGQRAEIGRQTRQLERQQADQIDVMLHGDDAVPPAVGQAKNNPNWMVYITNNSRRPIRDITATMMPEIGMDSVEATQIANIVTVTIGDSKPVSAIYKVILPAVTLLRAGKAAGLVFACRISDYPKPRFAVEFTDDAGLRWQIDTDLHLQKAGEPRQTQPWSGLFAPPDR
jgi:hypothetical protein